MFQMAYKIAAICALVFSGIFVLLILRKAKECNIPLARSISIWIFGIFLAIFPGKGFFVLGIIVVVFSSISLLYEILLSRPQKSADN